MKYHSEQMFAPLMLANVLHYLKTIFKEINREWKESRNRMA